MHDKRTSLEIVATSVEEAVTQGLEELGASSDEVEIEVLDSGSRGLFGLGSRQARVRLTIKSEGGGEEPKLVAAIPLPMPVPASTPRAPVGEISQKPVEVNETDLDETLRAARDTVQELLQKMKVKARVTAHYAESEEPGTKGNVWVDISGEDLSILIGPKSETLNALTYIAGLIVAKELGHSINLVVDVQGFRARREKQLRQIAQRMADQAIKTGRRQILEPMPANERRIIHIELRSHPGVTTESTGEDPRRKVTIIPK
jgi:spoIIIJ-associated protein